MCGLSKDDFCARAPVFVGDILWEHLQLLQQECDKDKAALKNAPPKLSEISTAANMTGSSPPRMYNASPVPTYTTLEPSRVQHQSPVYHHRASPAPVYQRSSPGPYEQRLPTPDQYKPVESKPAEDPAMRVKCEYPVKEEFSSNHYNQYVPYPHQYQRGLYQYPGAYQSYMPAPPAHPYYPAPQPHLQAPPPLQPAPHRWSPELQHNFQVTIILSIAVVRMNQFVSSLNVSGISNCQ